ncbi:FAD-dependent monooxygenase [Brevibacterium daeguense]|uniref:FAD-dependent monooxygenase n=1 Tax=Brevibacterium daeguense TaxID=909936 RepID=A0ABP8EJ01_9MICO|nr:FAD-dependent monooxygenase [Brevibacterium daeguense]
MRGTAVVVGAGIAGLATARGLLGAGWQVHVLDRAAGLPRSGTALGMWPEAMRALDFLGAGGQVRADAIEPRRARILRSDGTQLVDLSARQMPMLVPRPQLLAALAANVPDEHISRQHPVSAVSDLPDAEVVIAADGIHSPLREAAFGLGPRPLGTVAFRGTVAGPVSEVSESWGRSQLFGITPHDSQRTNWFASIRVQALAAAGDGGNAAQLLRNRYRTWHPAVARVLDSLTGEAIDQRTLLDLPPLPSYVHGRTALLGDAAHAMAPNLGRGACEALVDSAVLVEALRSARSVSEALERYDRVRRPRTTRIVRAARLLNRTSTASRLLPVRNAAVTLLGRLS